VVHHDLASRAKLRRGQPGVNLGPIWGQTWVKPGSNWGPPCLVVGEVEEEAIERCGARHAAERHAAVPVLRVRWTVLATS
jgi:hypothetical protein